MSDPRIVYVPLESATPEGEITALAAVYAFVIRAHESKNAATPNHERAEGGESPEQRQQGQSQ
jgi:hypothetical protein